MTKRKRVSPMPAVVTWILLVDPRERELSLRAFALWVRGYDVLRAGSVEEALELLEGAELAVLAGFEEAAMGAAIRAVKAVVEPPPVLVVDAAAEFRKFEDLGFEDGVSPARMADIVEQAKFLLARRHARSKGWFTRAGCPCESEAARRERIKREEILSRRALRKPVALPKEKGEDASGLVTFVTPEHSAKVFAPN